MNDGFKGQLNELGTWSTETRTENQLGSGGQPGSILTGHKPQREYIMLLLCIRERHSRAIGLPYLTSGHFFL